MNKQVSIWSTVRSTINAKPIGSVITRKELLQAVYGETSVGLCTVDTLRRQLIVCGYLKPVMCCMHAAIAGRWTIAAHIEGDLTSSKLYDVYKQTVALNIDRSPFCNTTNCDGQRCKKA